ncbi:MAG: hypothetical protein M3Y42_13285 [Actinomycetota bacterium]|nr:hypothetical protein [Actinomycetota bacterium]
MTAAVTSQPCQVCGRTPQPIRFGPNQARRLCSLSATLIASSRPMVEHRMFSVNFIARPGQHRQRFAHNH